MVRNVTLLVAAFFFIFPLANCSKSGADSDLTRAALLLGAVARTLGGSRSTGATGAVAALSAAGSGLSTGSAAFFDPKFGSRFMLASLMHSRGRLKRQLAFHRNGQRVRPAAFDCDAGPGCAAGSGDYTLSGTENCDDGTGIATANDVDISLDVDSDYYTYTVDGAFTFSGNCGTYSLDFENYPEYQLNRISGRIRTVGRMVSTESETSVSSAGFFIFYTQVITTAADNFRVNGSAPLVMDVRIDEKLAENIVFDPATDEIQDGIASGTIYVDGTINGQPVDIDAAFSENLGD